jgi:ABC-type multidrug transport system fused ATPase/permease subunit
VHLHQGFTKWARDVLGGGSKLNLSGGQGQRVCLARALVRNPRLLIFDESTSALDPHTEEEAVKTFVDLAHKENVAVVSVTHRLDTTNQCDTVLILRDGIVAEEGNPQDLLERKGLFYEMRKGKSNSRRSSSSDASISTIDSKEESEIIQV